MHSTKSVNRHDRIALQCGAMRCNAVQCSAAHRNVLPNTSAGRHGCSAVQSGAVRCSVSWCVAVVVHSITSAGRHIHSALQCVAVYRSVLQWCVAVGCSSGAFKYKCGKTWHETVVCCSVLQCCSSVLQCVAVCCSVLKCVAMCCSVRCSSVAFKFECRQT